MPKNYYFILGVPSTASLSEIKSAYRRLAKEFHPDYHGKSCEPFLEIQEAYSVLSDPLRRSAYDHTDRDGGKKRAREHPRPMREPVQDEPEPLIPEQGHIDLGKASRANPFHACRPLFDEPFNRLFDHFSTSALPKAEGRQNLNAVITLTPEQALRGGQARLSVPSRLSCPSCHGRGGVGFYECRRCRGRGVITGEQPIVINYPPGIADNRVVHLSLDRYGMRNLYLTVHFRISERVRIVPICE